MVTDVLKLGLDQNPKTFQGDFPLAGNPAHLPLTVSNTAAEEMPWYPAEPHLNHGPNAYSPLSPLPILPWGRCILCPPCLPPLPIPSAPVFPFISFAW